MKKDLVIIGSYPSNDLSKDILKQCIVNLNGTFDVAVSTHYPVNEEIQKLTNYYIFDAFNGLIKNDNNPVVWFQNNIFYLQVKHVNNYAYSAYSCMLNSVKLLQHQYEHFYFVNGDTLITETDISKLLDLKKVMLDKHKKAVFFKEFSGMVDSKIFLSETDFFLREIAVVNTKDEFIEYNQQFTTPYVPYVLESFFSERIDKWCNDSVYTINVGPDKYFTDSKVDVLSSFNGVSERKRDYLIFLVKEKISNKIFFVYVNNNLHFENKEINIKINQDSFKLNNGNYSFYKEVFAEETILLQIDDVTNTYNVKDIINNADSYIQFNG